MRKILFVLLCVIAVSCSKTEKVTVSGNIANAKGETLYFEHLHINTTTLLDSVKLDDKGEFSFKKSLLYPEFLILRLSNGEKITLVGEPKEEINVKADAKKLYDYKLRGSYSSELAQYITDKLRETKGILSMIREKYETSKSDKEKNNLSKAYAQIIEDQRKFSIEFITKHPTSLAAYMALYQKLDKNTFTLNENKDIVYVRAVASSLKALYPESEYTIAVLNNYNNLNKKLQTLKIKEIVNNAESRLPEIKMANIKGDTIKLSDVKSKAILLSFCSFKNKKCLENNFKLKELYKKYKNKGFQIFQVSLDKSKLIWEETIKANNFNWINVNNLEGSKTKAIMSYNVQKLPSNYLIVDKNKIEGKDLFGKALEKKLKQILK